MLQIIQTQDDIARHFNAYKLCYHNYTPACFLDDRAQGQFYAGFIETSQLNANVREYLLISLPAMAHLSAHVSFASTKDRLGFFPDDFAAPIFKSVLEVMKASEKQIIRSALMVNNGFMREAGEDIFKAYKKEINPAFNADAIPALAQPFAGLPGSV